MSLITHSLNLWSLAGFWQVCVMSKVPFPSPLSPTPSMYRLSILLQRFWTPMDKLKALKTIDMATFTVSVACVGGEVDSLTQLLLIFVFLACARKTCLPMIKHSLHTIELIFSFLNKLLGALHFNGPVMFSFPVANAFWSCCKKVNILRTVTEHCPSIRVQNDHPRLCLCD